MSIEFQSTLYRNTSDAHDAVAAEWISAGGMNGRESILEILSDMTDSEIAMECIECWNMNQNWFNKDELIESVSSLREFPSDFILGWNEATGD